MVYIKYFFPALHVKMYGLYTVFNMKISDAFSIRFTIYLSFPSAFKCGKTWWELFQHYEMISTLK